MLARWTRRGRARKNDVPTKADDPGDGASVAVVEGIYAALLGRGADASGLETYATALRAETMRPSDVVADIARSDEARSALVARSADLVVDALYRGILNRAPAPEELAGWRRGVANGLSLGELVDKIENSPEAWRIQLDRIVAARGLQDVFLSEYRHRRAVDG